jgi:hypothetical protein
MLRQQHAITSSSSIRQLRPARFQSALSRHKSSTCCILLHIRRSMYTSTVGRHTIHGGVPSRAHWSSVQGCSLSFTDCTSEVVPPLSDRTPRSSMPQQPHDQDPRQPAGPEKLKQENGKAGEAAGTRECQFNQKPTPCPRHRQTAPALPLSRRQSFEVPPKILNPHHCLVLHVRELRTVSLRSISDLHDGQAVPRFERFDVCF